MNINATARELVLISQSLEMANKHEPIQDTLNDAVEIILKQEAELEDLRKLRAHLKKHPLKEISQP
jgi:hypothetical protein